MHRTRVGYAGGKQDKPTYREIGDHTEAFQVEYDPKVITYAELLDVFWASHDPYGRAWSTQYQALLWTHGDAQARTAKASAAALEKKSGKTVRTEVRPAARFWIAEDYHQKYYLRSRASLLKALLGPKPDDEKIRESTVTARVNGWLAGHGDKQQIGAELEALQLAEKARVALAEALGRRAPVTCK